MSNSPYAPMLWREMFWWQFALNCARDRLVVPNGRIAGELPDIILRDLVHTTMREAADNFRGQPDAGHHAGQLIAKLMEQRHWVPLVAQYELNGRQIFDLDDRLVEMLAQTDLGDCTLEGLHLPYDCFYLYFGRRDDIKSPWENDFEYVDGALIAVTPWADNDEDPRRRLKIGLSTVEGVRARRIMMPGYFMDVHPEEQGLPALEALDRAFARRRDAFDGNDDPDPQMQALSKHRIEEIEEAAALAKKALPLIVNALFYLESIKELPPVTTGRDTPPEDVVAWSNASPEKRVKLRQKLTARGYTVVRLVGNELRDDPAAGGGPRSVAPHWRRGHWRQQAHGPGRTLRRRLWIRPMVINAKEGVPEKGHVYVTGASGNQPPTVQ